MSVATPHPAIFRRSPSPPRVAAAFVVAALAGLAAPAFAAPADESIRVVRATTAVGFHEGLLAALGVTVEVAGATRRAPHPLSATPASAAAFVADGGALVADFADAAPAGWSGGPLPHAGGFLLRRGDRVLDLRGFALRPVDHPYALALTTAAGERVLEVRTAMVFGGGREPGDSGDPAVLHLINGDLTLTAAGAAALGLERRFILGSVETALRLERAPTVPAPGPRLAEKGAPPPCGDWSGEVDVGMTLIQNVQQFGGEVDGRVVVAGDALLHNVGTANVPWYRMFTAPSPPYGNDQHPFLVWAMYRLRPDGVFEQMARSDLKHAFATANFDCDAGACGPPNGHILGPGCGDEYSAATNTWNGALAPRQEVDPRTGVWAHCDEPAPGTASHFDANGDCAQDFSGAGENLFTHGMAVATAELGTGDRYFFESWYVVRDDVDIFNSMGFREVDPVLVSGTWFFDLVDDHRIGPAVDAWVDPATPPAGAANVKAETAVGHVQLAVTSEDLGSGVHRYVYALQNHEVAAGLGTFAVAVPSGAAVTSATMVDTDDDAGNDWNAVVAPNGVRWTAPAGNAIPWGGLFTFVLEVDAAPAAGVAATASSADPATLLAVDSVTPGGGDALSIVFGDGFESGDASRWSAFYPAL